MEAKEKVKLQSLEPYRYLFPKALVMDKTIKKGASVHDTLYMIPLLIRRTRWQVQKYVDAELKGLSTYDACKKLWDFVKYHIEYRPDKRGIEQVRSPRRLIHDGYGDCDCGTAFISTCLYALRFLGAPNVILRITKYKEDRFQHIYPVVVLKTGQEIILDFVVHKFNYEEPYSEKKDLKMDLQFLDGIGDDKAFIGLDANDLYGGLSDIGELGQLLRKAKGGGGGSKPGLFKKKTPEQKKQKKEERKKKLLKVVNKVNKVNVGAALLRAGILASMKLNLMKVAEKLKWAYATREQAQSKGMDMSKYDKLKQVLAKAEKIFFVSGGKPENLRKAIITGRGNRNKEVAGLDGYNEETPLNELLGEIYQDEFILGIEGLSGDGMGVVTAAATTASITAATGTMAAIAALLKQVGSIFPKKDGEKKERKGIFNRKNKSEGEGSQEDGGGSSETSESSGEQEESSSAENEESSETSEESSEENLPATTDEETNVTTTEESGEETNEEKTESSEEEGTSGLLGLGGIKDFYQKNKKWIVPVGIAATAITVGLVINHYASKPEPELKPIQPIEKTAVNGVPERKRRRSKGKKSGSSYGKQSVIALM